MPAIRDREQHAAPETLRHLFGIALLTVFFWMTTLATAGLIVGAEIVAQAKADKVTVFKKRRRHNYRRKAGHRQQLTILKIVSIGDKKADKKAPAKEAAPAKAETAPAKAEAAVKADKPAAAPKAEKPKTEAKPAKAETAKASTKDAAPAKAAPKKAAPKAAAKTEKK